MSSCPHYSRNCMCRCAAIVEACTNSEPDMPTKKTKPIPKAKDSAKSAEAAAENALAAAAAPVTNGCVWSNNNAACANTWLVLKRVLGQIDADFPGASDIKMEQFAYWNSV